MEENILISNLNDFIFCPRSIYFHNLYSNFDEHSYHTAYQLRGKNAHKTINTKKFSTRKSILIGIDVYSDELGVVGKIDILDIKKKELIERKNKIKKIYYGYYLQIYAQYFCLIEMGYEVKKIKFYSITDNKSFIVKIPGSKEKKELKNVIKRMREFNMEDKNFSQNPKKCKMCIYKELCDYYDEQA